MAVDGSGIERDGVYAGSDLANAQRFNALVWILWASILIGLYVIAPPLEQGVVTGRVVMVGNVALSLIALVSARRVGFAGLMLWAYVAAIGLALLTWAAGGFAAPYDEIALGLVVCTALTHPIAVAVPYYLVVALLRLAPVAYGGTDGRLVDVGASLVMWGLVVVVGGQVMSVVRGHRHQLASRGDTAMDEARRDSLTGLDNRRAFTDDFPRVVDEARATGSPLALVVMDVDDFKGINDDYGHLEGDRALQAVADGLRTGTRPGDWLIRWGGDEFVLVMVGVDDRMAAAVCDRICDTIDAASNDEPWGPVRVTFGWMIDDGTSSVEWLLDEADSRLLHAKARGRVSSDGRRRGPNSPAPDTGRSTIKLESGTDGQR